jgi:hypothetical protein
MLVSRITQRTTNDVIEDGQATCLAIDGHRLMLPPRLADLVRQLRDQDKPRRALGRPETPVPWLFPGQSPARPAVDIFLGVRLHRYGIDAQAGRKTARLVLAASVLSDLTGISISTAERWSQWAKRDWAAYVGQRAVDDREDIDSWNPLNKPVNIPIVTRISSFSMWLGGRLRSFADPDTLIGLVPAQVVTRLREIDFGRGSEALYRDQMPGLLTELADRTRVQSITASSAIEGVIVADADRAQRIIDRRTTTLRNRSEQELAGYRDAQD